jgi:hypothetical protein
VLKLNSEHLTSAAERALTGRGDPPVILVDGVGLLDRDTVSRTIKAIRPALLAGDHRQARVLAATALRDLSPQEDLAAVMMRDTEARAFVAWFAGLAAEAALNHPVSELVDTATDPRVVRVANDGRPIMHLTDDDEELRYAVLSPGHAANSWLVETYAAGAQVSRTQLHGLDLPTAIAMAYAGMHVLAAAGMGSSPASCV